MSAINLDMPDSAAQCIESMLQGKDMETAVRESEGGVDRRTIAKFLPNKVTRKYVRQNIQGRLECEGAPVAYFHLLKVLKDETNRYDDRLKVDVAKFLLVSAGYVPPKANDAPKDPSDRMPSEMTYEELRAVHDKLEEELGIRAKSVPAVVIHVEVADNPIF